MKSNLVFLCLCFFLSFIFFFLPLKFSLFVFNLISFFFSLYLLIFASKRARVNCTNSFYGFLVKFILIYTFYEGIFSLLLYYFFIVKFSYMCGVFYLYKQGMFPFMSYLFFFTRMRSPNTFLIDFPSIFIFVTKVLCVVVYGKIIFCPDFHYFYCGLTLITLIPFMASFCTCINFFLGISITLHNILLGVLVFVFGISFSLVYYFFYVFFFRIALLVSYLLDCNNDFYFEDFKFYRWFFLSFVFGAPFNCFIFVEIYFLVIVGSFSILFVFFFILVSVLVTFFFIFLFIEIFKDFYVDISIGIFYVFVFMVFIWVFIIFLNFCCISFGGGFLFIY